MTSVGNVTAAPRGQVHNGLEDWGRAWQAFPRRDMKGPCCVSTWGPAHRGTDITGHGRQILMENRGLRCPKPSMSNNIRSPNSLSKKIKGRNSMCFNGLMQVWGRVKLLSTAKGFGGAAPPSLQGPGCPWTMGAEALREGWCERAPAHHPSAWDSQGLRTAGTASPASCHEDHFVGYPLTRPVPTNSNP